MPELAEVETARRQIDKHCLCKTLLRVDLKESGGHARDGLSDEIVIDPSLSASELQGRRLIKTVRKGKHIVWEFEGNGRQLVFHFGMTGNFRIRGDANFIHYRSSKASDDVVVVDEKSKKKTSKKQKTDIDDSDKDDEEDGTTTSKWPPRFTKALFHFSDDVQVAFYDPRRLGRLRAKLDPFREEPLSELAADPIHEMPDLADFEKLISKSGTREIKTILLDQTKVVCGIGNYLADECLHQAGIHPCQRPPQLTREEIEKLRNSVLSVCTTACKCLEEGNEFPQTWLFHGRWATTKQEKEAAAKRNVNLEEIKVGGRTTLFEPARQVLRAATGGATKTKAKISMKKTPAEDQQEAKPISKKKKAGKSEKDSGDTQGPPKKKKAKVAEEDEAGKKPAAKGKAKKT